MRTGGPGGAAPGPHHTGPIQIDAWFSLEPVGRIRLVISFVKHNKNKQPFDLGLGRKGAIRQRKEDIHEQYGHKFVQQQFYNIMRCALCGDFLKYGTGMQCSDCRYTCHKKCYTKVVTKCITQSNAETDPDEAKLNHRIPHRFENTTIMGAYWCCHCGYLLPLGRGKGKQCKGNESPRLYIMFFNRAQNALFIAMQAAFTLSQTSAGCLWRRPTRY
jgi:classical protein kinase C